MQLSVFNGSPRGKNSNSELLMTHFEAGYSAAGAKDLQTHYLHKEANLHEHTAAFSKSKNVILIFPLYTDAMPGIVKQFIETLAPLVGRDDNPTLGFVVQSGFPEAIHSRYVEQYLMKLAHRLGCRYRGTVIRGGVEGIKMQPKWMTKKTLKSFEQLGKHYAHTGRFDENVIRKLAKRDRMTPGQIRAFKFFSKLGLVNMIWDSQLRKNGVFDRRNDAPYGEAF
ncbi:NAD(P)H-dependent oxidoreductase [bacterium]|nr:NAD(P)H-dependent oxidoreductase [bacterium]